MKDVVNILKEENIYDKSFIVFKSDHGKPRIYYKKNTLRGKFLFNNNLWGYDRYRPFLMIKKPEEKKENLEAVNDMFYLSDLSNLYCKYGLLKSKVQNDACDELSNLLYKNFKLDSKNKKYIFVPKSSNDFKFDGFLPLPKDGRVSFLTNHEMKKGYWLAIGYLKLYKFALRVDVFERVFFIARQKIKSGPFLDSPDLMNPVGCNKDQLKDILTFCGFSYIKFSL